MIDKRTLIRIARSKEGAINIDPTAKMHGRAAYVCKSVACLQKAKKSKGLERSFKASIPPDIYVKLEEHLEMVLQ